MTDAIVAEELTYWYGELVAVDHISFNVAEGEILGFLGPNGAGKTTTVKMLTGLMKPKAGKAVLLGLDMAKNTQKVQGGNGRLLRGNQSLRADERPGESEVFRSSFRH